MWKFDTLKISRIAISYQRGWEKAIIALKVEESAG